MKLPKLHGLTDQAKAELVGLERATQLRIAAVLQPGDFRLRFFSLDGDTVRVNLVQNRKEGER